MNSNIYKVIWHEPDDGYTFGYTSFIVAANNSNDARLIFPNGDNSDWDSDSHYSKYWIPKHRVDELEVEYIGTYKEYINEPCVISYQANIDGI